MEEKEVKNKDVVESANNIEQINEWRKSHGFPPVGVAFSESTDWDLVIKDRHNKKMQFKGKEV